MARWARIRRKPGTTGAVGAQIVGEPTRGLDAPVSGDAPYEETCPGRCAPSSIRRRLPDSAGKTAAGGVACVLGTW